MLEFNFSLFPMLVWAHLAFLALPGVIYGVFMYFHPDYERLRPEERYTIEPENVIIVPERDKVPLKRAA